MRRPLLGAILALALVATSCGGGSTSETSESAETQPADAVEPVARVASTIGGGQIDFGSLAGRDVVLWFWAPW